MTTLTLSMNGDFDGFLEEQDGRELSAPGSDKDPGWTASDVADYNRERRLHAPRHDLELGLLTVSEPTLAARGVDYSPGWTASDVAEHNREKRLHGHSVH